MHSTSAAYRCCFTIVAVCLVIYFTLPETGSKTQRATVGLNDREVIEGELEEVAGASGTHTHP